ncbi:MAG: iron ABC transporter permease [Blastocatellia bacterium]|nr:iron ABC transporter permease [Blastocatellia bacterium]
MGSSANKLAWLRHWSVWPVLIGVIWGIGFPVGALLVGSLTTDDSPIGVGPYSLAAYREALVQTTLWESIFNSLWISAATVAGCAAIGIPLALLLGLFDFPGRRMFAALANLPLVLPPLVGVLAFLFLYDESGFATRLTMRLFRLQEAPWSLRGPLAIIAVHIYSMYAYFYSFTLAGLDKLDFSLYDAARSLGASPFQAWRKVMLPLLFPAFAGAALLTFMTSMASFSAPYLFGGGVRYLTIEIFNAYANRQTALALVECLLLAGISIPALIFLQRFEGTRRFASVSKGSIRRQLLPSRLARNSAALVCTLVLVVLLLPPLMLVVLSVSDTGSWRTTVLPTVYTLGHYRTVWAKAAAYQPIANSLGMSVLAAIVAGVFGLCAAYMAVRLHFRGKGLVTGLVLIPWVLPGTVVALAVLAAYGTPHWYSFGQVLIGTYWILPVIYFLRTWPLTTRAVQANMEQFDIAQEEAARTLGAGWLATLFKVTVPQVWPGLVSGVSLAFITLLGEFAASWLAYVYVNRPISVEIASQLRAANLGMASVYGVVMMILMGAALGLAEILKRRYVGQNSR